MVHERDGDVFREKLFGKLVNNRKLKSAAKLNGRLFSVLWQQHKQMRMKDGVKALFKSPDPITWILGGYEKTGPMLFNTVSEFFGGWSIHRSLGLQKPAEWSSSSHGKCLKAKGPFIKPHTIPTTLKNRDGHKTQWEICLVINESHSLAAQNDHMTFHWSITTADFKDCWKSHVIDTSFQYYKIWDQRWPLNPYVLKYQWNLSFKI